MSSTESVSWGRGLGTLYNTRSKSVSTYDRFLSELVFPLYKIGIGYTVLRDPRGLSNRTKIVHVGLSHRAQGALEAGGPSRDDYSCLAPETFGAPVYQNLDTLGQDISVRVVLYEAVDHTIQPPPGLNIVKTCDHHLKLGVKLTVLVLYPTYMGYYIAVRGFPLHKFCCDFALMSTYVLLSE